MSGFFGSTGGGGGGGLTSVAVDGTTIAGNGTVGNPLYSTTALPVINMAVDLSGGNYTLDGAGIYSIAYFGNSFVFNDAGIVDGSRVILTNSNLNSINQADIDYTGISGVKYQGTQESVSVLASGMTYEFVYDQASSIWYCLNPQPVPIYNQDLGGLVNPYDINTIGYYQFLNTGGGGQINLPTPSSFQGQEITIFNLDQTDPIPITNNQPESLDGTNVAQIPVQTCLTIVSAGVEWLTKSVYTV